MSRGWTHDLLLVTPGQRIRDDEGRWKVIGNPTPFRGRIAFRGASRIDIAGGRGEQELVAVQIPHGLPAAKGCTVLAENLEGRDAPLNGAWHIDSLSSNPLHLRAVCTRSDTP